MSDDLIKRQDTMEVLHRIFDAMPLDSDRWLIQDIRSKIADIPSADRPQGEWIPCSERLPSEQGQYLVTFPLCNEEPWVYILSFNKGKFYETDDEWGDVEYDDVTAWMPLPKPWKGADDE